MSKSTVITHEEAIKFEITDVNILDLNNDSNIFGLNNDSNNDSDVDNCTKGSISVLVEIKIGNEKYFLNYQTTEKIWGVSSDLCVASDCEYDRMSDLFSEEDLFKLFSEVQEEADVNQVWEKYVAENYIDDGDDTYSSDDLVRRDTNNNLEEVIEAVDEVSLREAAREKLHDCICDMQEQYHNQGYTEWYVTSDGDVEASFFGSENEWRQGSDIKAIIKLGTGSFDCHCDWCEEGNPEDGYVDEDGNEYDRSEDYCTEADSFKSDINKALDEVPVGFFDDEDLDELED